VIFALFFLPLIQSFSKLLGDMAGIQFNQLVSFRGLYILFSTFRPGVDEPVHAPCPNTLEFRMLLSIYSATADDHFWYKKP
jgi:hypothetical protein